MTRHQAVLFRQILLVFDIAVSAGAFMAALLLRRWLGDAEIKALSGLVEVLPVNADDYYQLVWLLLPMWGLALSWTKTNDFRVSYWRMFVRYGRAVGVGIALFVVAAFLYKVAFIARSFVALLAVMQLGALILGRILLLEAVAAIRRTGPGMTSL